MNIDHVSESQEIPPKAQVSRKKQSVKIIQTVILFILLSMTYYLVVWNFIQNVSSYWVWGIYISPIFIIQLLLLSIIYVHLSEEQDTQEFLSENQSQQEECFCATTILMPLILIWWPLFIQGYFGVYHDIIAIDQKPTNGTIVYQQSAQFGNENYTLLQYNIFQDSKQIVGYGCMSDYSQMGVYSMNPLPYKIYQKMDTSIQYASNVTINFKLASWWCLQQKDVTLNEEYSIYTSVISYNQEVFNLVTQTDPPFIPWQSFAILIGVFYQFMCFFLCLLIYLIFLYWNSVQDLKKFNENQVYKKSQQNESSQIELNEIGQSTKDTLTKLKVYPSRKRRLTFSLFCYLDWCLQLYFTIQLTDYLINIKMISYTILFLPALLFFIGSLTSNFHKKILQSAYSLIADQITIVKALFILILLILIPIYLFSCLFVTLCLTSMALFFSRIFIASLQGKNDDALTEQNYNKIANLLYLIIWLVRGPLQCFYVGYYLEQLNWRACLFTSGVQILLGLISFIKLCYGKKFLENQLFFIYSKKHLQKGQVKIESISSELESSKEKSSITQGQQ